MSQERKDFTKQLERWGFTDYAHRYLEYEVGLTTISYDTELQKLSVFVDGEFPFGFKPIQNSTLQDVVNLYKEYLNTTLELPQPVKVESTWVLIGNVRVDLSKVKSFQLDGNDLIINAKEYTCVDITLGTYKKAKEVIEKLDKYFNVTSF